MRSHLVVSVVCLCFVSGETAKILAVFPTPSISHQVVFRPLTQELARRGHEVVVITTDPAFPKGQTPENLTEIDVHDVSYKYWTEFLTTATGKKNDITNQMKTAIELLTIIVEKQMENEEVKKLIKDKNKTFDILLLEACVTTALGLSHIYKVPVIQVSSFIAMPFNYEFIGAPTHPLLYPSFYTQKLYNLTNWEKIHNVYNYYKINKLVKDTRSKENEMVKRVFGADTPSVEELSNNIDMLFLNVHPIWEGNYPVPPNVVYMGGLHQKPEKELPKDLKTFLDSSKYGVIYMSFGTNTNPSTLPWEKIQMFINVFSRLPYDILWKWDKDEMPEKSENIRVGKWFPQPDLLRHPKVKLFITQGGLQSTDESITAGVPLIGIPMLGDQWYNVEKYVFHKIGIRLDLETVTEDSIENAISKVIEDKSYKENVIRLRALMNDQPMKPLERAVWWVEHVLRHGGARHLRSPAANISWSQYLELELVAIVLIILFIGVTVIIVAILAVLRFLSLSSVKSKIE